MEVNLSLNLPKMFPNTTVESIVTDEHGNVEISLSAGTRKANAWIDATGNDHGTICDALLTLSGLHGTELGKMACQMAARARPQTQRLT